MVVELPARLRALALRPGAPARFAAATAPLLDAMQPAQEVRPTEPEHWARWRGRCPNHADHRNDDQTPSFVLSIMHGGVLGVRCFTCQRGKHDVHRVLDPLGLDKRDLFPPQTKVFTPSRKHITIAQANLRRDGARLVMQMAMREHIAPSSLTGLGIGKAGQRLRYPERRADGTLTAYTDVQPRWLRSRDVAAHLSHGHPRGLVYREEARTAEIVHVVEGPGMGPVMLTMGREPICLPYEKAPADDLPKIIMAAATCYMVPDFSASSRDYFLAVGRLLLRHDFQDVRFLDIAPDQDGTEDFGDLRTKIGHDPAENILSASEAVSEQIEPLPPGRPPRERERAAAWLTDVLGELGPTRWADVKAMMPPEINERTLRRARKGVATFNGSTGYWDLTARCRARGRDRDR